MVHERASLSTPASLLGVITLDEHASPSLSPRAFFEQEERTVLERLLVEHRYNVSAVARHLSVSRGALRHRLRKYGLP
ncbi:MAG: helix-turn-helix domain-containing protein [Myxococcota bacterium]